MDPRPLGYRKRKRRPSSRAAIKSEIVSEYQRSRNSQEEPNAESHDAHKEISVEVEEVSEGEDDQTEGNEYLSSEDEGEEEAVEDSDSETEFKPNREREEKNDEGFESNWESEVEEEELDYESNWECEEEKDYSNSEYEKEEEEKEENAFNAETDMNIENKDQGVLLNMFSKLSVTSTLTSNDEGSTVPLHIKFARDCLWKRHLISQTEMENFGDEDVKFCVWRLESRLGQAVIEAHKKWANILTHHIPLICPPKTLTLAEKLRNNEIQWSDKVVEIFLTWLYCGDGYCFIQTEEELLETSVALERLLYKKFNREFLGLGEEEEDAKNYGKQMKSFVRLRRCLGDLRKYISELMDDGEEHLPLDRRFRVNQLYSDTLDNFAAGKYGYAFFGTSTMAYRHGVLWEGLHVFKQHHVFAQDITVTAFLGPQHEYARYFGYKEMPEGPYNFRRRDQSFFRLVFVGDPEAEIQSTYQFLQHARRVTDNTAKDNCIFQADDTHHEEFQVGIFHSTGRTTGETAIDLNLQETKHTLHPSANQLYCIYKGDLRDLLTLVASGTQISEKQSLQASLIVKNPTEETFCTIYGSSEIIGYCFQGNFLVVSSSVSAIESLIQGILRKETSFNWRQTNSPRTILELLPPKISRKDQE